MDLVAGAVVVAAIVAALAFAVLIAYVGGRTLVRARRRGRHVSDLPTWYLGGQPSVPRPEDRHERR
ncbi:MAG: hypothetical protein ACRDGT_12780 [Candidatus Limnocylindria bacterium]